MGELKAIIQRGEREEEPRLRGEMKRPWCEREMEKENRRGAGTWGFGAP